MQLAAKTVVGHVRVRNEDALLLAGDQRVVAVCDGLGGHPSGDLASETAVDSLRRTLPTSTDAAGLVAALREAHEAVLAVAGEDPSRETMATTVVLAHLGDGHATVAHVGDSRAYLLSPDGLLAQITQDHGTGGYLTQALGLDRGVQPDVVDIDTPPGSRLLLCTDGLTNMVDSADIADLMADGDAERVCEALVAAALDRGGIDNVTVIVALL